MPGYLKLVDGDDERWHIDVEGDEAPLDISMCEYVEMPPSLRFRVRAKGKRLDFGHTDWAGILVISRRMADCFELIAPGDIQRIPAHVEGKPDGEWEVLNVLARPECIAHDKSNITYYP